MKKTYEKVDMEITFLMTEDIITTSGGENGSGSHVYDPDNVLGSIHNRWEW